MHVSHSEIVYISFLGAEVPFLFQRLRSRCYCGKSEDNKNIYLLIVCALAICNSNQIFLFFLIAKVEHQRELYCHSALRVVFSIFISCLQSNSTCCIPRVFIYSMLGQTPKVLDLRLPFSLSSVLQFTDGNVYFVVSVSYVGKIR